MAELMDYGAELSALAERSFDPEAVDAMLARALDALRAVVPYDLAAVLQLETDLLRVRVARGPLAGAGVARHRMALADHPTVRRAIATRAPLALGAVEHASAEGDPYRGVVPLPDGHACLVVPLFAGEHTVGALTLDRVVCEAYTPAAVELAGVYGQLVGLALSYADLAERLDDIVARLREHNRLLAERAAPAQADATFSPAMRALHRQARLVAETDAPVLLLGETGTGKEVLAQAIHRWSARREAPFVTLNCAAIPEQLVESELFGHKRGAFTGATADRPGRFATAHGGTLLLDEIGDLPLVAQGKLLRVLQEGTFEPVGSDRTTRVDVRVLAATHVDLEAAVRARRFREDLYYRLAVFPLRLLPLRDRLEDLPLLAETILADIARRTGRGPWRLDAGAFSAMRAGRWPGNVRQLVNVLERATILVPRGVLGAELFGGLEVGGGAAVAPALAAAGPDAPGGGAVSGAASGAEPAGGVSLEDWPELEEAERRYIRAVLGRTGGRVYGRGGAAEALGMKPSTLQSRMLKLGVSREG